MGSIEQILTGSYKNLLKDVAKILGFYDPLYGSLNGDSSVACVIIFSSERTQTYFRVGSVSMDVSESEESAAKHCLQALATDFALCLTHLNRATYEHCDQCERFFTFSSKVTGDVRGLYHDCDQCERFFTFSANTIQDERHWIKAFVTNCCYDDIRKFLGCNGCNKKTDTEKNEVFTCQWCHKKDSISMPRLALSFDAQDDTGSMSLTAFNETVAQLFGRTISELYAPETYDKITTYQEIAESIKAKPIYIELGPTTALAKNGVLKWVLKSVSLKPIASQEPKNKGLLLPTSSSTSVLPTDKKQDQLFTPPFRKSESSLKLSTPATNNTPLDSQLPSSTSINSESIHNSEATPQTEAELKVRRALDFSVVESSINPEDSIY